MPFPTKKLLMFASQNIAICPLFGKMNDFWLWPSLQFGLQFLKYSTYIRFQHMGLILMNCGIIWGIDLHWGQFQYSIIIFWNPVHLFQCNGGSKFIQYCFKCRTPFQAAVSTNKISCAAHTACAITQFFNLMVPSSASLMEKYEDKGITERF